MITQPIEFSASIEISAAPADVWALISDITRMGEWSPECVKAEWGEGSTGPAVGARYTGHNNAGGFEWSVPVVVSASVPGEVFAFIAPEDMDPAENRTVWTYSFAASPEGCTLTESFHAPLLNVEGSPSNFEGRYEMLCAAVQQTLQSIKTAAEKN